MRKEAGPNATGCYLAQLGQLILYSSMLYYLPFSVFVFFFFLKIGILESFFLKIDPPSGTDEKLHSLRMRRGATVPSGEHKPALKMGRMEEGPEKRTERRGKSSFLAARSEG